MEPDSSAPTRRIRSDGPGLAIRTGVGANAKLFVPNLLAVRAWVQPPPGLKITKARCRQSGELFESPYENSARFR
jgi:hypothetical protein